jgi:hypothetical protein
MRDASETTRSIMIPAGGTSAITSIASPPITAAYRAASNLDFPQQLDLAPEPVIGEDVPQHSSGERRWLCDAT